MARTDPGGRLLPPPVKPKRKGHEPSAAEVAAPKTPAPEPAAVAIVDLEERHQHEPRPERRESPAQPPKSSPPPAPNDSEASVRTTVYSDARIEEYLHEVRVKAAMARLDLTQSAVWRWAMYELMADHDPTEVVNHFITQDLLPAKTGRPRR